MPARGATRQAESDDLVEALLRASGLQTVERAGHVTATKTKSTGFSSCLSAKVFLTDRLMRSDGSLPVEVWLTSIQLKHECAHFGCRV